MPAPATPFPEDSVPPATVRAGVGFWRFAAIAIGLGLAALGWYVRPGARAGRAANYWAHGKQWAVPAEPLWSREARQAAGMAEWGAELASPLAQEARQADSWLDRPWNLPGGLRDLRLLFGRHRPTREIRNEAIAALGLIGGAATNAIPSLLAAYEAPATGPEGVDDVEAVVALFRLRVHSDRFEKDLRLKVQSGSVRERAAAAVGLIILNPADPQAARAMAETLDASKPALVMNAFVVARMVSRLGRLAAPVAPHLRLTVLKTYERWTPEALARFAYALWRADGSAALALHVWSAVSDSTGDDASDRSRRLCVLSEQLAPVPEFAKVAEPAIRALPTTADRGGVRSEALMIFQWARQVAAGGAPGPGAGGPAHPPAR